MHKNLGKTFLFILGLISCGKDEEESSETIVAEKSKYSCFTEIKIEELKIDTSVCIDYNITSSYIDIFKSLCTPDLSGEWSEDEYCKDTSEKKGCKRSNSLLGEYNSWYVGSSYTDAYWNSTSTTDSTQTNEQYLKSECQKEDDQGNKGTWATADDDTPSSNSSEKESLNFCGNSCSKWDDCGGEYEECYGGVCIPENWEKKPSDGSKIPQSDIQNLCNI